MNKPHFCRNVFLTDWRHKRLKNTIDLLLFHGEHFYGFRKVILLILLKTFHDAYLKQTKEQRF